MQAKLPVLACTDPNTDIGKVITEGGFGWWCESNDVDVFLKYIKMAIHADIQSAGIRSFAYCRMHYSVSETYSIIRKGFQE